MPLLEIRDQLAATKDLVGGLYLACRSVQAQDERAALCALSYSLREKLAAIDDALADLIGDAMADAQWDRG